MSSSSSKLAYLSKYTENDKKKKKKERKKEKKREFVVEHDEDDNVMAMMPSLPEEEDEEGPTVVMDTVVKVEHDVAGKQKYDSLDKPRQRKRRHDSDDETPRARHDDSDDDDEEEASSKPQRRYDSHEDDSEVHNKSRRRYDSDDDDSDVRDKPRQRYDSDDDDSEPPHRKPRRRYDSDDDDSEKASSKPQRRYDSDDDDDDESRKPKKRRYDSDNHNPQDITREKMSSGHSAGLQQAHHFRNAEQEIQKQKRQEAQAMVDRHGMGETVYRDKEGRKVDASQIKRSIPQLSDTQQAELNKGRVQKQQEQVQKREWEQVQESSFARYKDDAGLEDSKRQVIREGDPMAMHAVRKKAAASKTPERPVYKGPAPKPNRYGIRPGYRWDGVDRGNGFEDKVLASQYSANHKKEQAYRWSAADM